MIAQFSEPPKDQTPIGTCDQATCTNPVGGTIGTEYHPYSYFFGNRFCQPCSANLINQPIHLDIQVDPTEMNRAIKATRDLAPPDSVYYIGEDTDGAWRTYDLFSEINGGPRYT